jgi:hypothetical protein
VAACRILKERFGIPAYHAGHSVIQALEQSAFPGNRACRKERKGFMSKLENEHTRTVDARTERVTNHPLSVQLYTDRRKETYSFACEKDLISFFSTTLPPYIVQNTIRECRSQYVQRDGTSEREQKLQFIRKCEIELLSHLHRELGISEPTPA